MPQPSDPEKRKSYLSIYEELSKNRSKEEEPNGFHYPPFSEEEESREGGAILEEDESQLTDELDHLILMHRDAHFGGDFEIMLNYYYADEGMGIDPDIDSERIAYLASVEKELGQDLAPLILTGPEAEAVGRARQAYARIKEIYELEAEDESPHSYPYLIAELILSEEEEPTSEIEAIVSQGTPIVPELIALLRADDLYNPLFPGYGYAPYLATLCLGKIGDPSAIIPIFETLSKELDFDEIVLVESLAELGEPAKVFLLKTVQSRPITQDNIHAAFALSAFVHDPSVALICFKQLQDPEVQEKPLLRTYLICLCDSLAQTPYASEFIALSQDTRLPADMRKEMKVIMDNW